jgi:hypothetical protein
MVAAIYTHVDRRLHPAAAHSVLAHMIHLLETGHVECEGEPSLTSLFRLKSRA